MIDFCWIVLIHLNFGDHFAADLSIVSFNPNVRSFDVHSRNATLAYSNGSLQHVIAIISTCLLVNSVVGVAPTLGLVTTAASATIKDC